MVSANTNSLKKVFLILLGLLVAVGLIALASAGAIDGQRKFGETYYYLYKQITQGVLWGLGAFILAYIIPLKFFRKISLIILAIAILSMLALFIPGLAPDINGANRWLFIGPIGFQPVEFLKVAIIIYFSALFAGSLKKNGSEMQLQSLFIPILILAFIGLLLLLQPDIGSLGVVGFIGLSLFYFARVRVSYLAGMIVIGALMIIIVSLVSPYRLNRLKTFLNPANDQQNTAYHINQALIGVGSGGWLGLGYGRSVQKTKFLPEPVGDSIFAVTVEENGFLVGALIVGLLMSLVSVSIFIAMRTIDPFGQLIIYGFSGWLFFQTFIHVGAITGILPLTGVPLPFISFGSSSMVALLAMSGLVLNSASSDRIVSE